MTQETFLLSLSVMALISLTTCFIALYLAVERER